MEFILEFVLLITTLFSDVYSAAFSMFLFFAIIFAILFVSTILGVKHSQKLAVRTFLVGCFVVVVPIILFNYADTIGRPKPISMIWYAEQEDPDIISYELHRDVAIYLWLAMPNSKEPMSIVLPWDRETAKKLREAQRRARQTGARAKFRFKGYSEQDSKEKMFYEPPQLPTPPKAVPDKKPFKFIEEEDRDRRAPSPESRRSPGGPRGQSGPPSLRGRSGPPSRFPQTNDPGAAGP